MWFSTHVATTCCADGVRRWSQTAPFADMSSQMSFALTRPRQFKVHARVCVEVCAALGCCKPGLSLSVCVCVRPLVLAGLMRFVQNAELLCSKHRHAANVHSCVRHCEVQPCMQKIRAKKLHEIESGTLWHGSC